jgi:hypothetical protein
MPRFAAILACAMVLFAAPVALADAPALLPVSGWLADTDGVGLDGEVDLTISLYATQSGGFALFDDVVTIDVDAGFFTAYAGENSPLDLALFAEQDELWMGVAVDGGAEAEPRARVATAPWAGFAEFAGVADDALLLGGVPADDFQLVADDADTLAGLGCQPSQLAVWSGLAWTCQDQSSVTEADPVFSSSAAGTITNVDVAGWNSAVGWGDHSAQGYLTSYVETDPVFAGSAASGVTYGDVIAWNTAYSWGDHATQGYLTSVAETDPAFSGSAAATIASGHIANWNTSYGWGDHASAGYISGVSAGAGLSGGGSSGSVTLTGGAYGNDTSGSTTYLTSSCQNYANAAVTVTAASSGTVLVTANSRMKITHVAGTRDELQLGIGTTTTSCGSSYDTMYYTWPPDLPSFSSEDMTFTVMQNFSVSAGTYTYYLNGRMASGYAASTDNFWFADLHAVFIPD